jgi:L-cysteine/cystine lyase
MTVALTAAELRAELPATLGCAYLNAGTNGPMPRSAQAEMEWELACQVGDPRIGRPAFERFFEVRARARRGLAGVICAEPQDVAITGSTRQGVAVSVAGIDWTSGDEIVTSDAEHFGLLAPLMLAADRHRLRLREVPVAELEGAIDERTRLVAVSHVLWTTGATLPIERLAARVHAQGALLLLDGAQAVGNIATDVPASGADLYAFSGQKWLLGPQGTGGLWVRPELQEVLWPVLPSSRLDERGRVSGFAECATRFDTGTVDPVTLVGLASALEWIDALPGGRSAWQVQAAKAAAAARVRLSREERLDLVDGDSGLIALRVADSVEPAAIVDALAGEGVFVRTIPDTPFLRLSIGAWTSEEDVERFVDSLAAIEAVA